jgi:hypothetical protein
MVISESVDKILSSENLKIGLVKEEVAGVEDLKCVGQIPVKCYTIDDRSSKSDTIDLCKYTYWRYLTRIDKEFSGDYIIIAVDPKNILYDNMYNPERKGSYTDLIIKPGRYTVLEYSHCHWSGNKI